LALYLKDREIKPGVDRLSIMNQPALEADHELKVDSGHSPYMRDER
jgi:hypothetical protein